MSVTTPRRRIRAATALGCGAAGLLALLLLLRLGGGAPAPAPAGLPDPGALTGWGLPILGYVGQALGLAVVGSLIVPLLTSTRGSDALAGRAVAAVFVVRRLAFAWTATVLAELVLTFSDQFAVPVADVRWADVAGFARQSDQGQALLVQAGMILVLALVSRWILTVREATALLVLSLLALLPPVLTGHSASAGSHDTAIVSLLLHVSAASLWVGGVIGLWWHLTRATGAGPSHALAARRFGGLAAWCLGIVLVSGLVNAWVRLGSIGPLLTSDYGRGVLVKIAVLVGVALVAHQVRRAVLGAALTPRALVSVTVAELGLMAVAVALGVGLGRTPPPVGEPYTSLAESLLGGPAPPAPTPLRLLTSFTPSGVGLAVVGLGSAAYLVGVLVLRRRQVRWSPWRTSSWFVGLLLVAYATLGGLGTYSHVMFSVHMAAHMLLSMVAPIFLVLGAPVTLALRALPGSDLPGGQGPRQWLSGVLASRPARAATHPVTAAVLTVGSLYAIYLTSIYDVLMRNHLGHAAMELHFLLAGYVFFEVLVGDAPIARRLSHLARFGLLLVVMPFHAFFAITVMSTDTAIGGSFYTLLDRGYATDLLADQYVGGSLTWALGELPMVLILVVLLAQWYRSDTRDARNIDRRADRDHDAELVAYNASLSRLAAAETARVEHARAERVEGRNS